MSISKPITGAVVILAAGITAGVVIPAPVLTTHVALNHSRTPGNVRLASTTSVLADGSVTVNFLGGVTLTVAPGWTIDKSWGSGIWAHNTGNTAQIGISFGKSHAPDITGNMAWCISADTTVLGYTNVVQDPSPAGVQAVQGKNFTQALTVGYTAIYQGDEGTIQYHGSWALLFNVSTQLSACINLRANSADTLAAAMPAAHSMIASML